MTLSAREQQMADMMNTYYVNASAAEHALECAGGTCEGEGEDGHEHDGDELAAANTHAVMAAAAASMFQGLAALEAVSRQQQG